ncbi:hypothetical protein [Acidithrix sp. C25]|uniref:hypothetical protein n=1 Tax=Acidithrix sp. C25 TaxID=1671482 RepID=UPI00191BC5EF|nr:hypothetical protein [Acidithrix sp. C25]CAG4916318.1 unnamed protein product [Acidithrix sp. C25]
MGLARKIFHAILDVFSICAGLLGRVGAFWHVLTSEGIGVLVRHSVLRGMWVVKAAIVAGINCALEMNSPKASYVEIKAREYLEPKETVPLSKCPEVTNELVDLGQYEQLLMGQVAS